ncbi:LIC11966 family surface protein [Niabella beijingensis]|uniref:LIC11966 family surface protein n=1 Tax=Niabella beijingensis TaxID=2872700 RepID=UPI001CC1BE3E|nr:hypothetical protein [Niabella beijingensis]MBZ4189629.1 hypothetical protein [Niabella beijingensis]
MKHFFIVAVVCLAAGFISCGGPGEKKFADAGAYDSVITARVDQMQQTLFAVQKVTGADDSATADLGRFVNQIDSVAKSLKELPAYKGNTGYRDAAVRLADFYKKSVSGSYAEIGRIYKEVKDSTLADNKVNELIIKLQEEETLADDAFIKEREAFAAKNNIKLEEDPAK